jgi:hypothetical protein
MDDDWNKSRYTNLQRLIVSILTLMAVVCLVLRHYYRNQWDKKFKNDKLTRLYHRYKDISSSEKFSYQPFQGRMFNRQLIIEILILAQSPIPFYDFYIDHTARGNAQLYYFLSEIQTAVMTLRTFFLARAFFNYSRYVDNYSKKLCQMYGFETCMHYTIKCELKERPTRTIILIMIFFIIQYSYLLRIFEIPYYRTLSEDDMNYRIMDSFFQSIWLVTITVTTVGYGDFYACTIPGQLITLCMAITGTFLMAMVVTIIINNIHIDSK